jgi:hypothetical protein
MSEPEDYHDVMSSKDGRCLASIRCGHQSCHDCQIDWDYKKYVEDLKARHEWWHVNIVSSMARMIYHDVDGHVSGDFYKSKVHFVSDPYALVESNEANEATFEGAVHKEAIASAKSEGKLNKVVVLVFMDDHFKLLVFEISTRTVRLVDGHGNCLVDFWKRSSSDIAEYTRRWFGVLSDTIGGGAEDYRWEWEPYLKQKDATNCGPIAVLAFYYELTGAAMLGERKGTVFKPCYRSVLVDKFVDMFKGLYSSRSLVKVGSAEPWKYVFINEAYHLRGQDVVTVLESDDEVNAHPLAGGAEDSGAGHEGAKRAAEQPPLTSGSQEEDDRDQADGRKKPCCQEVAASTGIRQEITLLESDDEANGEVAAATGTSLPGALLTGPKAKIASSSSTRYTDRPSSDVVFEELGSGSAVVALGGYDVRDRLSRLIRAAGEHETYQRLLACTSQEDCTLGADQIQTLYDLIEIVLKNRDKRS